MFPFQLLKQSKHLNKIDHHMLESARAFARQQLPNYLTSGLKTTQTRELYSHFGTLGLLGPTLPSPYGSELSYKMYGLIASEIEWVDSSFRSMYSVFNVNIYHL